MPVLMCLFLLVSASFAQTLPTKYLDLVDYVQEAPDQGDTVSCLYVASTGAMELLANKHDGVLNPEPYGKYDLAESFLIHAPHTHGTDKSFWEKPVLKFNGGFGIHSSDWPFEAWDTEGNRNMSVWNARDWSGLPRVKLPQIETVPLFIKGNKWSTNVLTEDDILRVKEAMWKYKSPVMVNYNDNRYWHVVLLVGFQDDLPGACYQISERECGKQQGSFLVRDSFGRKVELRDYDWFRVKGNAAFVVKEKQ